ncbi:LMWPc-domain-containing protein [Sistotremastrum suecicum HHB10207 ss-3]|uniref:LMWPc-domain-containing protein n=1 Tax=Sistotremastrum suecicum HHB10207 ss-3 TaxID=1314776 RepID=A0A166CFR7_9AGAM|nr:LMWPc-domain-containing protein [Sistotremastrum suecicum HHB10207 ss-3]
MPTSVLIVCLGNICRSPMGEAVLKEVAKQRGLDVSVQSAGTAGYHVGEEPDERLVRYLNRTVATCKKHNIPINHEAQQVGREDFRTFDYILGSDANNVRDLERLKPKDAKATVALWGSFDDGRPIADPYYGGIDGFERCYQQCVRYSNAFLDQAFGEAQ